MSQRALYDLLEEQHKFLSGDRVPRINSKGETVKSKSIYRETKSDKKPTVAGTDVDTLTAELIKEIKRYNDVTEADIKPIVEKHVKWYVADLYEYFATGKGSMNNNDTASKFKVRLIGNSTAFGVGVRARKGGKPFRLIRNGVSGENDGKRKQVLVARINEELKLQTQLKAGSLAVTHQEGSAVATQREAVVLENLQKFMVARPGQKEILRVLQQEDVETNRITHELLTTGKFFDIMTLRVGIGSGGENKSQGAGDDEQGLIKELKDDLIAMMSSYKDPGSLEGSDTPVKRVRKKVLHTLKKELKNKNIKVNFENTKIDLKAQRAKRKKDKGKKATGIAFAGDNSTTGGRGRKRQSGARQGQNFMQLAGLINQKLPKTVMKNMKPPGLENVTGRFASSVRVTDVTATPKGFPSIGYTYEKNPYQVFEMGQGAAPWATLDRDPRNVIDRSIREIAAEMAIGRFFTRRV